MRKAIIIIILMAAGWSRPAQAQNMGVSFSFFFPKNGYFSIPVSPFSIRGVGFNITNNLAIETGGSLYLMSGMNISDLPFESRQPLMGPIFNIMVPLELVLQFGTRDFEVRFKGGGFAFYNFSSKINYGNMDRALARFYNFTIANSELDFDNKIGLGYEFGLEYIQYFNRNFGITIGANYYIGGAKLNLRGQVTGSNPGSDPVSTLIQYPDARLDYTGLEISLGILFGG